MFEIYDKVLIDGREKIIGTIIEIEIIENEVVYTVESDDETTDEFGTLYPLFYCKENELKKY